MARARGRVDELRHDLYEQHDEQIAGQPGIVGDYNSINDSDPTYAAVFAVRIGGYIVSGGVAHHGYLPKAEARVPLIITSLQAQPPK